MDYFLFLFKTLCIIFHIKKKSIFMARKKMSEEDKKKKFSVTINEELLKKVDDLNDDKRSRLIEKLLEEYFENKDK